MPTVEIYHAQMCGLCHEAMDWFTARGIPFAAYELKWSGHAWEDTPYARDMRRRCGPDCDFVPQIFINGKHVSGWRTLSALIDSGEIQSMLNEGT